MKIFYNKLVRDKIPQIIEDGGKNCHYELLTPEKYLEALAEKLLEEAQETAIALKSSDPDALVNELADLYEVIDSILLLQKIDTTEVILNQKQKREERGSFQKRLKLIWVEENSAEKA
jgi:predicted house-cleaning noncanonical NTP pyrophosphatase (MazG superfamily)